LFDTILDWAANGLANWSWWEIVIYTLVMTHITISGVTIFLHRCMAHRSLDLHPIAQHFFLFWLWLGGAGIGDLPLLLAVSTAAAIVLGATLVITQCLPFWLPGSAALSEELFNMLLLIVFYPQNAYGFLVRLVLFTVFPAAYIGLLPVEAVRDHSLIQALGVLAAAVAYGALAVWVFERGLRRYASGNRILELR